VHVVALATNKASGAVYRARLPMQALARRGHSTEFVDWEERDAPPPFERLRRADVVHMWRLYRGPARRLAAALKEAGVAVVFDNDDDITRVPKGSPAYAEMRRVRAQLSRDLSEMLRLADMVTTTGGELAGRLRRLGGRDVRIVENYVEETFVRPRRPTGDDVVIGWVAGMEHRGDLKDLRLRRTLELLLASHPQVRVASVGLDLGVRSDRYVHHGSVALSDLPGLITQFDVGLAPIADVSFNRVRSNIKVKEYAAAGVPWLASPIGPYRGLGEEQGGRLVANHRWTEELTALIEYAEARAALAQRAAAWGETQTMTANVERWEEVFADVAVRVGRAPAGVSARRSGDEPVATGSRAVGASAGARATTFPRPETPASPVAASVPAKRGLFRRRKAG
jgi:glycosyltransferase involved in cell wall biosynthesis